MSGGRDAEAQRTSSLLGGGVCEGLVRAQRGRRRSGVVGTDGDHWVVSLQPEPADLRAAISDSIVVNVKAYNVAVLCERLGLDPLREREDPFSASGPTPTCSRRRGGGAGDIQHAHGLGQWHSQQLARQLRGVDGEEDSGRISPAVSVLGQTWCCCQ